MSSDVKEHAIFRELIHVAIGKRRSLSYSPSTEEWYSLCAVAEKQSLLGVCFYAVQKLPKNQIAKIPSSLKLKWLGMVARIQKQNEIVFQRCKDLSDFFAQGEYKSLVLKGQGNAIIYGLHERLLRDLRQSGDIDLWVEGKRDEIVDFIRSKGIKIENIHLVHATAFFFENVPVEIHFRPSWMYNSILDRRLQKLFETQASKQFDHYDEKVGFAYPTTYFNLVHSMVHINRHIFEEGVGLRQLMDYYYILQDSSQQERNDAYKVLCLVGLKRFVGAVMYVMRQVFLLEDDLMLCEPNSVLGLPLLDSIIAGGNFGKALRLKHGRNKLEKGLLQWKHNLQLLLPYANEAMWIPLFQIWHYLWRKRKGYL